MRTETPGRLIRVPLLAVLVAGCLVGATGTADATGGAAGTLSVVAGVTVAPHPGPATESTIAASGAAVDGSGNLYIADSGNQVVEKVTPAGTLSLIAGTGSDGAPTAGPATSSKLRSPSGVAVDGAGNLYIADSGNSVVEKVTPSGALSIIAGTGSQGAPTPGPATSSKLSQPSGVAVDGTGNLYIADSGNSVVEKVTPAGTLSLIAGTGSDGAPTAGPATSSKLHTPSGVAVDGTGNLYIADSYNNVVEKVTPSGTLSIIVGTSNLNHPSGVAVDGAGNLYIADSWNSVVEKVTPSRALSIIAGTGSAGGPTPGPATSSMLGFPWGVAVDGAGNLYIADSDNNDVEKVTGANPGPGSVTNTAAPSISGTARVGSVLTASSGTWSVSGTTYAYQWSAGGTPISGATGSTYTPVPAEVGKAITVAVTATKQGYTPGSASSAPTAAVSPGALSNTASPSISGTPRVGSVLTASSGSWSVSGSTYTYQWSVGGTPIRGATGSTYTPVPADVGKAITVTVTATKPGYAPGSASSAPTAAVAKGAFKNTKKPAISGVVKVGQTLKATAGSWSVPGVKVTYQWLVNGHVIKNATRATLKLMPAYKGKKISVKVTATKAGYTATAATSATTKPVK